MWLAKCWQGKQAGGPQSLFISPKTSLSPLKPARGSRRDAAGLGQGYMPCSGFGGDGSKHPKSLSCGYHIPGWDGGVC